MRRRGPPAAPEWEVLLVQSRWTRDVWLFPKGGVEPGESARAAAVRETEEEGGVVGDLGPKLGSWVFNPSAKHRQKMWLLFVTTEYASDSKLWKERKKRLRAWHSFESAKALITDLPEELRRPQLLQMLQAAEDVVKSIGNGVLPVENPKDSGDDDGDED